MIEWLSSFSGNLAALGVAGGIYFVYKLFRRVRCARERVRACGNMVLKMCILTPK